MAAEAVVSGVGKQLGELLFQQAKGQIDLLTGVEDKVCNLSKTFEKIQAVLVDAERNRLTKESVKIWLQELEDVSYEIDDVLDEWNYQILRKEIEGSGSSTTDNASTDMLLQAFRLFLQWVSSFTPASCFSLEQLVINREIAKKITEFNAQLDRIAKEKENFRFDENNGDPPEFRPVASSSLIDESEIFGRETDKNKLISQLLPKSSQEKHSKHAINIVAITGGGGIGKTTLAKLAYNDKQVEGYYKKMGWVYVSKSFDEIRIAKAILEALRSSSSNLNELNSLLEQIRDSVSGKEFFLVFDNVWTEDQTKWQPFKDALKGGAPGSTILLTTRSEEVARVAGATCTILLDQLSFSDSCSLFWKEAFFGRPKNERARFQTIGEEIVKSKCKGLPLAIKTLGGLLCSKNTLEGWQKVKDSNLWELKEAKGQLFPHLYLSYSDLSPLLRRCFTSCAVFPKGTQIVVNDLIRMWLGQGYINSTKTEIEMEMKGRGYFEYLAARSFFQDFQKDSAFGEMIVTCKMHDIVHDFAQFLTETECVIIKGKKKETLSNRARHLTWIGAEQVISSDEAFDVGKLRSFFANKFKLDTLSTINLLNNLKLVRVLKFSDCHFKELPNEIRNLIHLRYLGVCNNDELTELPKTVYDLYNLQTLDLDGCLKLRELPLGIEKLKKLRHLIPSRKDMKYPEGIRKLTQLQTLKYFQVWEFNQLGYLESLNQLRGSLCIRIAVDLDKAYVKDLDLKSKEHIQELTLRFFSSIKGKEDVLEALEPTLNTQILNIIQYRGTKVPTWMTSLKYLRHLKLKFFSNLTSLPTLGILPLLEKLEIENLYRLKSIGPAFLGIREQLPLLSAGFPMLDELTFIRCKKWEEWEDITPEEEEEDIVPFMPCLRWLMIAECPQLETLPYRLLSKVSLLECIQFDNKKYSPSTILSSNLTLAEAKARKPDYQSMSKKEALQLERLEKVIADVLSKDNNLQMSGTSQFNALPINKRLPNNEVIQSGIISRFVEFLAKEDFPQLQYQAALAITKMASGTSEHKRVVIDHGALPNLVKLISSPRDDIREQALLALGYIACDSCKCRDLVLEHGALMPLLLQLNEDVDVTMLRRGAWALFNFCWGSQFEKIKHSLPTLQRLIYSKDEVVLGRACRAFSCLLSDTNNKIQATIEADVYQRFVDLLRHPSPTVLIPLLKTITSIMEAEDFKTQCTIDMGGLPCLLSLLSDNHEESNSNFMPQDRDKIQIGAARALKTIACGSSENVKLLIDHGSIPIFVKLLGSPSKDACKEAALALGYIARDSTKCRDLVLGHGALMPLLHQLKDANLIMRRKIIWVLGNFYRHKPKPQVGQIKPALPALQRLIYENDEAILRNVCWSISNLFDGTNDEIQAVIEAGICQRLVELLIHPSPALVIRALETVRTIIAGDKIQAKSIIDKGGVPCLLSLLSGNHEESNSNFTAQDRDKIQFMAAQALKTIASGSTENINVLIDHGSIPVFVKLLGSPSVCGKAVSALGYIAGDSPECRDLVLEHGALMPLLHQLKDANRIMHGKIIRALKKFYQHEPRPQLEQVKPALLALQRLIYENDEGILRHVCLSISFLISDGTNDEIQAVIETGICQRLVELLMHPSPSVLIPALQAVGAIVKGNNEQTQAVIEAGLIPPLLNLLKTAKFGIKKWAARAISDVILDVTDEQMKFLVSEGCIKPLCDLLICPDPETVTLCLKGLEKILAFGEIEKDQGDVGYINNLPQMIEEAEGLEKIKILQAHDDHEIRERAARIFEIYSSVIRKGGDDNKDDDDEGEDENEGESDTQTEGNQAGLDFGDCK